ncbi:MAG TPA: response regulator [Gemmatimonadaceae bacterium]|nr:response regulator [Gemmatimonadaceae bacterium]
MSLSVLLVEDNVLNQELARDLLEASGHRVHIVENADGFRRYLREGGETDIILMDVLLPGTDGVTLVRELRSSRFLPGVPVIAVTAQALTGDSERFLSSGFDAVITKPIDTRTFVSAVEQYAVSRTSKQSEHGANPDRR